MINEKEIAEKFCVQLLRYMPGIYVSSFGGDASVIIDKAMSLDKKWDIDLLDEIMKQLSIVPEYLVERLEDGYNVSKQHYLKIEFFNCPAEEIRISNDFLQDLKRFYPHTRLLIVTPYDAVFYSIDVDNIKDGENLDLKNHTIEATYKTFTRFYDDADMDVRTILRNNRALFKILFGTFDLVD